MNRSMLRRSTVCAATATLALASGDALADGGFSTSGGSDPSLSYNYVASDWSSNEVGGYDFGAGYTVELHSTAAYDTQRGSPSAKAGGLVDVPATFFDQSVDLFRESAVADTTAGTSRYDVVVLGAVVASLSAPLPGAPPPFNQSFDFVSATQNLDIAGIPVTVSEDAVGTVSLSVQPVWQNGTFNFIMQPGAAIVADLSAGVGGSWDGIGASAGVDGGLTVLSMGAPLIVSSRITPTSATTAVRGNLNLAALSGDVGVYAQVCIVACERWDQNIYSWGGLSWRIPLFDTSSTYSW